METVLEPAVLELGQTVQINSLCKTPRLIGRYGVIVGFDRQYPRVKLEGTEIVWNVTPEILTPTND